MYMCGMRFTLSKGSILFQDCNGLKSSLVLAAKELGEVDTPNSWIIASIQVVVYRLKFPLLGIHQVGASVASLSHHRSFVHESSRIVCVVWLRNAVFGGIMCEKIVSV